MVEWEYTPSLAKVIVVSHHLFSGISERLG